MGEIADMMLDGTLCEHCGAFIGNPCGYPRYCCKQCALDAGALWESDRPRRKHKKKKKSQGVKRNAND